MVYSYINILILATDHSQAYSHLKNLHQKINCQKKLLLFFLVNKCDQTFIASRKYLPNKLVVLMEISMKLTKIKGKTVKQKDESVKEQIANLC